MYTALLTDRFSNATMKIFFKKNIQIIIQRWFALRREKRDDRSTTLRQVYFRYSKLAHYIHQTLRIENWYTSYISILNTIPNRRIYMRKYID